MEFVASLSDLHTILLWILSESKSKGLQERDLQRVEKSSEEALVNIIKHAYQGRPEKVEIDIKLVSKGRLEISFKDQGPPFNPLKVKSPDTSLPLEKREVGGLGIFLIRKLVDDLQYVRIHNQNLFTFVIHFS